jgi:hypothetical protein
MTLQGRFGKLAGEGCTERSFITWYVSKNVIRAIKLRRMRWAGHRARKGQMKNAYNVLSVYQKGNEHLEDLGVDGKMSE